MWLYKGLSWTAGALHQVSAYASSEARTELMSMLRQKLYMLAQAAGKEAQAPPASASNCGQGQRLHAGCLAECSTAGGQAAGMDLL